MPSQDGRGTSWRGLRAFFIVSLLVVLLLALSFTTQKLFTGREGSTPYSIACIVFPSINASGNATLQAKLTGFSASTYPGFIQVSMRYEIYNEGPSTVSVAGMPSISCSFTPAAPPSWRVDVSQSNDLKDVYVLEPGEKATINLGATIQASDLQEFSIVDIDTFTSVVGYDPERGLVIPYSWEPVEIAVEGLNITVSTG
ncbi:MAG: hypothetical protein F7B18_02540 [Desulfurococcales archaeon]|nr:hypothetical protein [Desulfurococcales archaeon]